MAEASRPDSSIQIRFETTSIKIEKETDTLVKISVLAKLILDGELGDHPYFIEEESYAACIAIEREPDQEIKREDF